MRKSKPKKRIILPDPKFNDVQVTRFVNNMMVDGKKSIAYDIFYDAVELVEQKNTRKRFRSLEKSFEQRYACC
jgi:small subunit ribosomal protein S7